MITYQNAYDENGNIVNIKDVDPKTHKGRIFRCISCGKEMRARIGEEKAAHFAHIHKGDCSLESYLHKMGKYLFKKRFYSDEPIYIEYPAFQLCDRIDTCPMADKNRCKKDVIERKDLKEWYDTCTEEKEFNGFRADLLLECSNKTKNIPPLFIEIVYKHKSTQQKIESKNKIIEIDVWDEKQVERAMKATLRVCEECRYYNFEAKATKQRDETIAFWLYHYILYNSGKTFTDHLVCRNVNFSETKPTAEFECIFYNARREEFSHISTFEAGTIKAIDAGFEVRNCDLCKYSRTDMYGEFRCNMHKRYGTPESPQKYEALTCNFYRINKDYLDSLRQYLDELQYKRLPVK